MRGVPVSAVVLRDPFICLLVSTRTWYVVSPRGETVQLQPRPEAQSMEEYGPDERSLEGQPSSVPMRCSAGPTTWPTLVEQP